MDLSRLIDALKKRAAGAVQSGKQAIANNPTPAGYIQQKLSQPIQRAFSTLGSNVESAIRPPVSPIPETSKKAKIATALRNIAGSTANRFITGIPSGIAGAIKTSPPVDVFRRYGDAVQGKKAISSKDYGKEGYRALSTVGSILQPASSAFGGVVNVGMQGVLNKIDKKPFFENYPESFSQGYSDAAALSLISKANPIFSEQLSKKYVGDIAQKTIPKRAAMAAIREGTEGAVQGLVDQPDSNKSAGQNVAEQALFGLWFGGSAQTISDLSTVGKAKVLQTIRDIFNKPNYEKLNNIPVNTMEVNLDGSRKQVKMKDFKSVIDVGRTSQTDQIEPPKGGQETPSLGSSQQNTVSQPEGQTYSKDVQDYVTEMTKNRKDAKAAEKTILGQKATTLLRDVKEKMIDTLSPIEDAITEAEKKYGFKILPKNDIRMQFDRVLRNRTLASQFAEDNGFTSIIRNTDDLDVLDQYMIAKQAKRVRELGKETGRDAVMDGKLIQELGPKYEALAQQVNQYSRKLLQYSVDSGLITQELADDLIKKYPEYVPLNRVFNEMELPNTPAVGIKPKASLSRQTVVQKIEGSKREIESPIESLLLKTQTAFMQGEKNKAGRMLASYKDLPGMEELITEITSGQTPIHSFSFLDNGVKRTFSTTPEIEAAAKSLTEEQMGFLFKIFINTPVRVLQTGAVGLNVPFVLTNVLKDQVTTFINSSKAAKTSLMNPMVFVQSVFSTLKEDNLYKEVVRNAAGGNSFDIARKSPELSVARIRAGKSMGSKIKYTVTHPGELLRAVEDIIGKSESIARIQNYKGTKDALLKEGRTLTDATALAAQAARNTTANFSRHGSWSKQLNYMVPFFNAGIQGTRSFVNAMKDRPAQTGAKLAVGLFLPTLAATTWNVSDEKRKVVYDDISEYEKENNIIIIPDNPERDERGTWNVIKIPIPPGLSNLSTVVRRTFETTQGLDPIKFKEIAGNLFTVGTSLDVMKPTGIVSNFVPQGLKPLLESSLNKNLYTGRDIVPSYMTSLPPDEQVFSNTSGTARAIGGVLNTSPLKVQNAIKTGGAGVGSQLLNASDTALSALGVIPKEQVGGESIAGNLQRRFSKASGGEVERSITEEADSAYNQVKGIVAGKNIDLSKVQARSVADAVYRVISDNKKTKDEKLQAYSKLKPYITDEVKTNIQAISKLDKQGFSMEDRRIALIPEELRARAIYERLQGIKDKDNRLKKYQLFKEQGLITPTIISMIQKLSKEKS